jgi:hypothetical protein
MSTQGELTGCHQHSHQCRKVRRTRNPYSSEILSQSAEASHPELETKLITPTKAFTGCGPCAFTMNITTSSLPLPINNELTDLLIDILKNRDFALQTSVNLAFRRYRVQN